MNHDQSCTRNTLYNFLRDNRGENLLIKESGGGLLLKGKLDEVSELNLCGRMLVEAGISLKPPGLEAALTLHEDFAGLQLQLKRESDPESTLSILREIPYHLLSVTVISD